MVTEDTLNKRSRFGDADKGRLGAPGLLRELLTLSCRLGLLFVLLSFCSPNAFAQDPNKETDDSTRETPEQRSQRIDFENGIGISACGSEGYQHFVAEVISVIGGDQVVVAIRDHAEDDEFAPQVTVQLVGIEFSHQSGLLEDARKQLETLVLGKTIWVSYKLDTLNSRDRVVGKVSTDEPNEVDGKDRTDAGLQQIKAGFATYKDFGQYSLARCDIKTYLKAEAEAKKAQRGIWKIMR